MVTLIISQVVTADLIKVAVTSGIQSSYGLSPWQCFSAIRIAARQKLISWWPIPFSPEWSYWSTSGSGQWLPWCRESSSQPQVYHRPPGSWGYNSTVPRYLLWELRDNEDAGRCICWCERCYQGDYNFDVCSPSSQIISTVWSSLHFTFLLGTSCYRIFSIRRRSWLVTAPPDVLNEIVTALE